MTPAFRHSGVSLIELMIALAIGALLVLGLVEVFSASRAAYQLSSGLARTQENGRFAMDVLQRDLRMVGHMGCINDQARFLPENITPSRPALVSAFMTEAEQFNGNYAAVTRSALRFDKSIEGYEAVGTASGGILTLDDTPTVATSADSWSPALPSDVFSILNDPIAGSDILFLRHFAPAGAQVTGFVAGLPASITFNPSHSIRLTEGVGSPTLFGIADCMNAAVFQASAVDMATGEMEVAISGLNQSTLTTQPFVGGQATLYRAESLVYYVGLNAQGNPALYRARFGASGGAIVANNEELVEGIELMQLQFGQDSYTGTGERPSGNIGKSAVASALDELAAYEHAWRRVGLVQIGLLARSAEPAAVGQRNVSDETPPLSVVGVTINPPSDTYYRSVYEDSIALRNRLYGN